MLVLDEGLAEKLRFVKEGQFVEKDGAATLKLVGDVVPIEKVEVVKRVKEHLTDAYPLSAKELLAEVKNAFPGANANHVWDVIRDNEMKANLDYSAFNFRNKMQEDEYQASGKVPSGTPSIYNHDAVGFIVKVLQGQQK